MDNINYSERKMFLIISHELDEIQKKQAKELFHVKFFIRLPEKLQEIWSNIPPEIENVDELIVGIKDFIKLNSIKGDVVLVQGDYGATYKIVNFCKENGLLPVYATTKRITEEKKEGDEIFIKRVFKHVRFREY
ncbi:CRISPR-associated protein Csx20 [Thermovenabulum sp.]|uniref:CRISPR-associated protein Csx20 n=1 Tax=Thermovenabulum sp. TaxID=3100335 RepID=UPI003C7B2690